MVDALAVRFNRVCHLNRLKERKVERVLQLFDKGEINLPIYEMEVSKIEHWYKQEREKFCIV